MKKIPGWLVGMLVVLGVGVFVSLSQSGTSVVYENNDEPANEPAVETPAWMQDEDAIAAAEAVVKRKELEAREAELVGQVKALQTELDSVRKEIGTYWSAPGAIEALIRKTFPEDPITAIAVARAESGFNPRATNAKDKHKTCYGSYGIFQVGCVHGHSVDVLYDVEANIRIARALYDDAKARTGNGWQPWGAYTSLAYQKYMP